MRENYLAEAFKDMDALNEDVFSLDNLGTDALKDFLDGDKGVDFIAVIDTEAEDEEDIKDSYLGKVILDCCTCHSKCYKNKADIVLDDDEEYANVGEECAYCHSKDGFKIVGEVTEYDEEKDREDEEEDEDETEVEIKKDSEEEFDDNVDSFDFEEEEKVEESLNEAVSKTDDIDAEADDKKELAKKELDKKIDDADSDRDYRLKKGITRRNESKIYKKIKESRKPCKEDLSYGEYATIEDEWKKFKEKTGRSDAEAAWEFIETECKGTYDTDEEKQDVFSYISTLEEPIEEGCKKEDVNESPNYELHPRYDARQSFYGKARVDTGDKGDKNKLFSYDTLVAEIKDGKPVVYGAFSATTLRHIKDWLKQNGFKAENKAQILRDYGVKAEAKKCGSQKPLNETGEWEDDEDGIAWKQALSDKVSEVTGKKVSVSDIRGFDKYQGPYYKSNGYEFWMQDEMPVLTVGYLGKWYKVYDSDDWDKLVKGTLTPIEEAKKCDGKKCRKHDIKRIEEGWRGSDEIEVVSHGEWADPDLVYKDYTFNYWDIEDALWDNFLEETGHKDSESEDPKVEAEFDKYVQDNAVGYLEDCIAFGYFKDGKKSWRTDESKEVNEAYYDTTRVLEIVSPRTRARLKRIIDTQKQKYGNDMEISVMVDSPYKAHLNYGEGGADYRKDTDGKWKHDFGYIKIDSALADAIISDVCKSVGMCEKMNESVEEVKVTTETDEVNVKTEDGKVTVETQKREDEEKKDEEVIEPVSDEVKSEIEAGSEKEIDGEFGDEVEVDMDDFDEESFDELGESYFKSAYNNIDSYKTSCVKAEGKRMVIEGVIKFKSGKEKSTSFVLESKEITKSGKSRFIGENMQICKGKKAFALNGTINSGRFISESFNYDYRTKDIKTGKSKRISGTVKKK